MFPNVLRTPWRKSRLRCCRSAAPKPFGCASRGNYHSFHFISNYPFDGHTFAPPLFQIIIFLIVISLSDETAAVRLELERIPGWYGIVYVRRCLDCRHSRWGNHNTSTQGQRTTTSTKIQIQAKKPEEVTLQDLLIWEFALLPPGGISTSLWVYTDLGWLGPRWLHRSKPPTKNPQPRLISRPHDVPLHLRLGLTVRSLIHRSVQSRARLFIPIQVRLSHTNNSLSKQRMPLGEATWETWKAWAHTRAAEPIVPADRSCGRKRTNRWHGSRPWVTNNEWQWRQLWLWWQWEQWLRLHWASLRRWEEQVGKPVPRKRQLGDKWVLRVTFTHWLGIHR